MNTQNLKNYGTRLILELLEVHEGIEGLKKVQTSLNQMGKNLTIDGIIGNITLDAIKSVNNQALHKIMYNKKDVEEIIVEDRERPNWISIAYSELGVKEKQGNASNPRIEQYHTIANGINWKDDVPWCASFVTFVMIKAGKGRVEKHAYRAKAWAGYGKFISTPVLGAIAIKEREGGGHVGFVVGESSNGQHLYLLGGNQDDEVNIKRYAKNVFTNFRVPIDYQDIYSLPIMKGTKTTIKEA